MKRKQKICRSYWGIRQERGISLGMLQLKGIVNYSTEEEKCHQMEVILTGIGSYWKNNGIWNVLRMWNLELLSNSICPRTWILEVVPCYYAISVLHEEIQSISSNNSIYVYNCYFGWLYFNRCNKKHLSTSSKSMFAFFFPSHSQHLPLFPI